MQRATCYKQPRISPIDQELNDTMKLGKIRNELHMQIDDGYTIIQYFIKESEALFTSLPITIEQAREDELASVKDIVIEPEYQLDMQLSIISNFGEVEKIYHELIYTSRRSFLTVILSFFEGYLKRIYSLHNISPKPRKKGKDTEDKQRNKETKQQRQASIDDLLNDIEFIKGKLPASATTYKKIVCKELRPLRNYCTHQGEISPTTKKIINKNPKLELSYDELHIKDIQVLLDYLNASKELLEIIEEHCRNNP